jgi:undecaprenyl-diphosphatase
VPTAAGPRSSPGAHPRWLAQERSASAAGDLARARQATCLGVHESDTLRSIGVGDRAGSPRGPPATSAARGRPLEESIVRWIAGLGGVSPAFDSLVTGLAHRSFYKGGVVVAAFWWLWFDGGVDRDARRERLLAGLFGAMAAALASTLLTRVLPFRARPALDGSVAFHLERGTAWLVNNNSFPSDHAALFVALVVGLLAVSRWLGILSAVYVIVVVLLPRLYLGYHWPSDMLGGAALGVGFGLLAASRPARGLVRPVLRWCERSPGPAHAALFLLSFAIADLFESLRWLASMLTASVLGPGGG